MVKKIELLPPQPHYWAVIAKQQISVSTPQILRQIDYTQIDHLDNSLLLQGLRNGDWQTATKYMGNVLEPLTMRYYPEIKRLKDKMLALGADVAQMSGTGTISFCNLPYRIASTTRVHKMESGAFVGTLILLLYYKLLAGLF